MNVRKTQSGSGFNRSLRQRQGDRLHRYLRDTVLPFSPYYGKQAKAWSRVRSLEDFGQLPFTTKAQVQENIRDFVLTPDKKILARRPSTIWKAMWHGRAAVEESLEREFRPSLMTFTTGRSNQPLPFIYTARDVRNLQKAGEQIMRIGGARRDMRMLNMFPYAPHLAFWQTHYAGTEFGAFMVSSGGGKVAGTEGNLRLMEKLAPEVLIGMPTFIYHVLQEAVARKLKCPQLGKISLGGEKAPPGMRRKLKDLAAQLGAGKIDVLTTYGFTEAKMAWPECCYPEDKPSGGFHLFPDLGIIEIIDPRTGNVVGEGEPGEIVFTPLDARGTVVLRYRTGDLIDGGLVYAPCPHCGRCVPRLVGDISRTSEIKEMHLDKVKGTLVDFNQLEHVLDNFPSIGTWQLELCKVHNDPMELDEVVLHVENLQQNNETGLRQELNEKIAAVMEMHPNRIVFESSEEMRRLQGVGSQLKEQRVVDHRPKAVNGTQNGKGVHHE